MRDDKRTRLTITEGEAVFWKVPIRKISGRDNQHPLTNEGKVVSFIRLEPLLERALSLQMAGLDEEE